MPIYKKIYSSNGVIGFSQSKAVLLLLDKAFSYCFSTRQRAKLINFKEIIAIFQVIARWIQIFKDFH